MMFRCALPLLLSLAISTSVVAQEFKGEQLVTPALLASSTAIEPNHPFTVGILLKMAPGWHTYSQFSGDSGAATEIEWELPAGFTAAPIQWPIPTPHRDGADFLTYIYEGEVMLLVDITPPATLPPGEHTLNAKLKWLVCEKTCIPGDANVALALPSGPPAAANAELFAHWRSKLPKNPPHPFESNWRVEGAEALLRLRGLPRETSIALAPLPPPPNVRLGHPRVDEPAPDGVRTIHLPFEGDATAAAFGGVLITQSGSGPREGWLIPPSAQASRGATLPSTGASSTRATPRLVGVLGFAFLGGLILNLMPCVLPVIALKIFGFMQQAGEAPERIFRLGLAFAAGVFAFFLGLAALVAGLHLAGRGLNWGFQFQNAYILTGLIALVFVFALSMFGLFEVTLAGDAATRLDSLSRREGYFGAFTHGLFTTLLGTSCTAPFLGPVLGFAFVQPPAIVFLIFAVIAAGMSLPYVLLTWRPAWMRFLPKPGAWMERLKQFMGFVLLAVVVWLLGVLGDSRGAAAVTTVCAFLLALGLACWLYGAFRQRFVASVLALLLLASSWFIFIHGKVNAARPAGSAIAATKDGVPWEVFSPAKIDEARAAGRPVFIDFTADWCLNCKYNEKFVIETEPVRAAFKKHNVLALKADWTNGDPLITTWLKKYDRIGVPVYVIYPKQNAEPSVLPEILTQTSLLEAISRAGS